MTGSEEIWVEPRLSTDRFVFCCDARYWVLCWITWYVWYGLVG